MITLNQSVDLYHLVYVSSACEKMSPRHLSEIESISQLNNLKLNVTGVLLYENKKFMQFLEGPENSLLKLISAINNDGRHYGIDVMRFQSIPRRQFPGWQMRMTFLDEIDNNRGTIFNKLFKGSKPVLANEFAIESHSLMLAFKNTA